MWDCRWHVVDGTVQAIVFIKWNVDCMGRQLEACDAVGNNAIIQHSVHHVLHYVQASISPFNPRNSDHQPHRIYVSAPH
jgi:hypothetical protein